MGAAVAVGVVVTVTAVLTAAVTGVVTITVAVVVGVGVTVKVDAMSDPLQRLVQEHGKQITELLAHGCSDGNCQLVRRLRGMHTNGGCRCYAILADLGLEMAAAADQLRHRRGLSPV